MQGKWVLARKYSLGAPSYHGADGWGRLNKALLFNTRHQAAACIPASFLGIGKANINLSIKPMRYEEAVIKEVQNEA